MLEDDAEETEEYQHSPLLPAGLLLASLAALIYCIANSTTNTVAGLNVVGLLIIGILAEMAAPPTGTFGFFPLALPLYVVAASSPQFGPAAACFSLVAGLLLRTLSRGSLQANRRWLELTADLCPTALLILLASLAKLPEQSGLPLGIVESLRWAGPCLAYWFCWAVSPAAFAAALPEKVVSNWTLARERAHLPLAFLLLYGLLVAALARTSPQLLWPSLLLVLTLKPQLHAVSQMRRLEAESVVRAAEQTHLERTQDFVRHREAQQRLEGRELEAQREVFNLLEALVGDLSEQSGANYSKSLLSTLKRKIPCRTLALYARQGEFWQRVGFHGPDLAALNRGEAGLEQSLVAEAWRTQQTTACAGDGPLALVAGETALAYLLPHWGVLYAGDTHPTWDNNHRELLSRIAPHLSIYVDSARFYQVQQQALELESGLRLQTEKVVLRLSQVLDALRHLVGLREPQELLRRTFDLLPNFLPHEVRALHCGDLTLLEPAHPDLPPLISDILGALPPGSGDYTTSREVQSVPAHLQGPALPAESQWFFYPLSLRGEGEDGWLALFAGSLGHFPREDVETVRLFLWHVGSLLENAHLYAELRQAMAELKSSQAQVVQSSKLAAIGQLAAGVAHELNTPLGAICVAIDGALMALPDKPERVKQRLEKANPPIEQMREIISKLLYYSRDARSGRSEMDLERVVQDSLQMVGHMLRLDGIEVKVELTRTPVTLANSNEMQQVITNLLINAKDACLSPGSGGHEVTVRTYQQGTEIVLEVEDQGCGMDEETCKHIFEPFFTTKPVGQGTGLGLSTTMLILQQHHGTIEVQSQVGKGTRFQVRLPIVQEE